MPPKRTVSAGTIRGYAGRVAQTRSAASGGRSSSTARCCPADGALTDRTTASCSHASAPPMEASRNRFMRSRGHADRRAQHDGRRGESGPCDPRPPQERCQQTRGCPDTRGRQPVATSRWRLTAPTIAPAASQPERGTLDPCIRDQWSPATGPSRTWRAQGPRESAARRRCERRFLARGDDLCRSHLADARQ